MRRRSVGRTSSSSPLCLAKSVPLASLHMQADLFRRSVDLKGFLRVSGYRTLIFRSISPCSSLTDLSTLAWSLSPWLLSLSTFQHRGASICQKAHKDVSPSIHLFLGFVSSSIQGTISNTTSTTTRWSLRLRRMSGYAHTEALSFPALMWTPVGVLL